MAKDNLSWQTSARFTFWDLWRLNFAGEKTIKYGIFHILKENSSFNLKPKFNRVMSWVRIWVHLVFTTKNRRRFLQEGIRKMVFDHMRANAQVKNIWLDCVNGYEDHVHCLLSLGKEQCISGVAQLIKGESSFWINKNKLLQSKFNWQDDFWAVSINERSLGRVRKYIFNQEQHHKTVSFEEELDEFLRVNGFQHYQ